MLPEFILECLRLGQVDQAHQDLQEAKSTATDAQVQYRLQQTRIERLEQSFERLTLVAIAVTEILQDRLGVSQREIDDKVREIDLRDGNLDGRLRSRNDCAHCNHTNSANRQKCLYCGEPLGTTSKQSESNGSSGT